MLGEYDVLLLCRLAMNKIKNIAAFFFFLRIYVKLISEFR